MGLLNRPRSSKSSDQEFCKALESFQKLHQFPEKSFSYRKQLLSIVLLCQKAIRLNDRNGDAHILLANTFFLFHIDKYPEDLNSRSLKLAAALIQHWNDEPMRQYPWTKNIGNGRKIYDIVTNAFITIDENLEYHIEQNMRNFKIHFYKDAISFNTYEKLMEEIKLENIHEDMIVRYTASSNELEKIWDKWESLYISNEAIKKCEELFKRSLEYIWGILELGFENNVISRNKSYEYGSEVGDLVGRLSRFSFMVGLEFSNSLERDKVPGLLKFAEEPLLNYMMKLLNSYQKYCNLDKKDFEYINKELRELINLAVHGCYECGLNYKIS